MLSSRRRPGVFPVMVFACALLLPVARSWGQTCNLNPNGPDQLILTVPGGGGTDFDLGWTGEYHDIEVPRGAQFSLCLNNCDETTDPICDVEGYAGGQEAVGRSFTPPIPIIIGDFAGCVVTTFQEPFATGTANLETGAIDVTANVSASLFITTNTAVCVQCSGATVGAAGTCQGGANDGAACTTHDVVEVENAVGDTTYQVSRDCLPSGLGFSLAFTVPVTTGTAVRNDLCPSQAQAHDCGAGTCTATCTGGGGGIAQRCCSNATAKRCFPTPLERVGETDAPLPAWPNTTWPKASTGALASVFCAPGAPFPFNLTVNGDVGLPGPATFILPVDGEWILDPTPIPTTTTTTLGGSTTTTLPPGGCNVDAECDDGDPCTTDACTASACVNTPLPGAAGAACEIGDFDPTELCGAPIDAKLAGQIASALSKAQQTVAAADGASAKKVKKARNKAKKLLKGVLAKVKKAAKKDKVDDACSAELQAAIAALQQAVLGI